MTGGGGEAGGTIADFIAGSRRGASERKATPAIVRAITHPTKSAIAADTLTSGAPRSTDTGDDTGAVSSTFGTNSNVGCGDASGFGQSGASSAVGMVRGSRPVADTLDARLGASDNDVLTGATAGVGGGGGGGTGAGMIGAISCPMVRSCESSESNDSNACSTVTSGSSSRLAAS